MRYIVGREDTDTGALAKARFSVTTVDKSTKVLLILECFRWDKNLTTSHKLHKFHCLDVIPDMASD